MKPFSDEYFMRQALAEAQKAFDNDEVPIGAVVVIDNRIISRACNQTELLQDATAHAEMLAITSAMQTLGSKYLQNATLYVTVEPCIMCAGAIFWSKISKLVYATTDEKGGFFKFQRILKNSGTDFMHPKLKIVSGVLEQESAGLMKRFFEKKRKF